MKNKIEIALLVDDTSMQEDLLSEHGLSWAIRSKEGSGELILFDTGQGKALVHNASKLGFDLKAVSRIVLSHGHYDHSGGLAELLSEAPSALVYSHPAAAVPRYSFLNAENGRLISMPESAKQSLEAIGVCWIKSPAPVEVLPSIWATGSIPRGSAFEEMDPFLCLDLKGTQPDPFEDDQAVFIKSSKGTIVILGCAHSGVLNTLNYIRELTNAAPIYAVLGGMHLLKANKDRIERTVEALRSLDIKLIAACHCSGENVKKAFADAMPEASLACGAGFSMEFEI